MVEYETKISSKGQIVIPKEIREKYGFKKGVKVVIKPIDKTKLLIERTPRLSELFDILEGVEATKILFEEREKEVKVEKERLGELE